MDSSDLIRKIQGQTRWVYLKNNTLAKQATCNFSTCSVLVGCNPINYASYEEKNSISIGKYNCNTCSTTTIIAP